MTDSPAQPSLLDLRGITKRYEGASWVAWALSMGRLERRAVDALAGVDLRVDAGEVVGILGPNGAGKSTLLRCAAGLLVPTSGTVLTLDEDPSRMRTTVRGRVGFVSRDDRSFNYRLTARQNLDFFARLQQLNKAERAERVASALKEVALTNAADRPYRTFSTGMGQRLGIARALLGDPKVLILDEATSGLDPGKKLSFYELVQRLINDRGLGVVYATHDLTEAERICTRVIVMHDGQVVADGSFADVIATAEDVFARTRVEAPE